MKQAILLVALLAIASLGFANRGENNCTLIPASDTSYNANSSMEELLQQIESVAGVNDIF